MAEELLTALSLSELLGKLHSSITEVIGNLNKTIEVNKGVTPADVSHLRDHITDRISKGDEAIENKKLLAVLNLLAMDRNVIEFIKTEAEQWLVFVDTIEKRLSIGSEEVSEEEKEELEQIDSSLQAIREGLRK